MLKSCINDVCYIYNTCHIMFGVIQGMRLGKLLGKLEDRSLQNNLVAVPHVHISLRKCEATKTWNIHTLK